MIPNRKREAAELGYGAGHRGLVDGAATVIGTGCAESSAFLHGAKRSSFSAREIIYREGEAADTVYAIRHGLVKLISYLPNGRGRIVRLYGKGIWVGLEGLLRRPYAHTAIAIDEVEVYRLPASTLRVMQRDDPSDYQHLMQKWHEHLVEADMWISDFSTGSVRSRVARLINFLSRIEEQLNSGEVKLLTCDEMAAILGVTPESVSRIIAEFKRGGVLRALDNASSELYRCDAIELERVALQ
ncbi:MAG: Crp/Fnr family transcriptional regulator [Chromatiales bacterium]|jgi:CRP-like cAMP-binding protein|nr:Crp/Fnr family transcriptional regulator [Chromatiales bacterium]